VIKPGGQTRQEQQVHGLCLMEKATWENPWGFSPWGACTICGLALPMAKPLGGSARGG
jgi:hypothetical protein